MLWLWCSSSSRVHSAAGCTRVFFSRLGSLLVVSLAECSSDHPFPEGTAGRRHRLDQPPWRRTRDPASGVPETPRSVALWTWCQTSTCVPVGGALKRHRAVLPPPWHTLALNDLGSSRSKKPKGGASPNGAHWLRPHLQVRVLPGTLRVAVLRQHTPRSKFFEKIRMDLGCFPSAFRSKLQSTAGFLGTKIKDQYEGIETRDATCRN